MFNIDNNTKDIKGFTNNAIPLYHGSEYNIAEPKYGGGISVGDFGQSFYCTQSKRLACEWAVKPECDGYCNIYELDTTNLNILNLDDYNILYWVAIVINGWKLKCSRYIKEGYITTLNEFYNMNIESYDVIIGNRADDDFMLFIKRFLMGNISLQMLEENVLAGALGRQYAIKSEKALSQLRYVGCEEAKAEHYLGSCIAREKLVTELSSSLDVPFDESSTFEKILEVRHGKF